MKKHLVAFLAVPFILAQVCGVYAQTQTDQAKASEVQFQQQQTSEMRQHLDHQRADAAAFYERLKKMPAKDRKAAIIAFQAKQVAERKTFADKIHTETKSHFSSIAAKGHGKGKIKGQANPVPAEQ